MLHTIWNHPDLYFFLSLLAGLAVLLAIAYELFLKMTNRPDALKRDRHRPSEGRHVTAEDESRQAGKRPSEDRGRKGKRP
jgi:hypothetical protein